MSYIRANHYALFPKLLSQNQFNRRARGLCYRVEKMRRDWLLELGVAQTGIYLIDTKPLPVLGYKRSKHHSDFRGSAGYGYCASRKLYYFGYKLVMVTTPAGIPVVYELVAAHIEERKAAETVLDYLSQSLVIGDKGFLGQEWQAQIRNVIFLINGHIDYSVVFA